MNSHTTVVIPRVGVVAFPNTMQGSSINDAAKALHLKAVIKSVLKFVARDKALTGLDPAKFYQQLSTISALLEKYPSLARAADAGIHGEKVHDLKEVDPDLNAPVEPEDAPAEPEDDQQPEGDQPEAEQADNQLEPEEAEGSEEPTEPEPTDKGQK